jgi:hypothetical protein
MSNNLGYIPRKCSFTKQLITASDHGSIQISIKKVKIANNIEKNFVYVISGNLRKQGKSDWIINQLIEKDDNL